MNDGSHDMTPDGAPMNPAPTPAMARGFRYATAAVCILTVLGTLWLVRWQRLPLSPDITALGKGVAVTDFFTRTKLEFLLAGAGLAAVLAAAWLASRRRGGAAAPAKAGWLLALTGVLAGAIAVSSVLSAHPQTAWWGFPGHGEGAAAWAGYLALFWAAGLAATDAALAGWLLGGVVAGAAGVGGIALAQTLGWDPLMSEWGRHWIAGAGHDLVANSLRHKENRMMVCGTLGNSNYLGSLAALAAPLALGLALASRRAWLPRLLAAAVAVLLVVVLAGSQSRAGLAGLAVGLAVFGWLWYRRQGGGWSARWVVTGAGVLCLAGGLLVTVDLLRGRPLLTRLTGAHMQWIEAKKNVIYRIEEDGSLVLESAPEIIRIEMDADGYYFFDSKGQKLSGDTLTSTQRRPGVIPIRLTPPSKAWVLAWLPSLDGLVLRATENRGVIYYFLAESDGFHPVTPGGGKNRFTRIAPMAAAAAKAPSGWSQMGSARGYIWQHALPLLPACWLTGYGPDTFPFHFPQTDQAGKLAAFGSPGVFVDKPHNLYLGLALGAGLPALAAFLVLAGIGIGRAARMATAPGPMGPVMAGLAAGLAGYLTTGGFNDSVVGLAPTFWVCLAVAVAATAWPAVAVPARATAGIYDIQAHRRLRNYRRGEMARRLVWGAVKPLFRFSPRIAFGWRNGLLRLLGAEIGRDVRIYNTATIYFPWKLSIGEESAIGEQAMIYNLGEVRIGARCFISQRAHLCAGTHDYRKPEFPLLKIPVGIGDDVWVCADAFVGPGVRVGNGAVVGARAVVTRDVPAHQIVAGNPARMIGTRLESDGPKTPG